MSYEPTEWKTGDVVTSQKLNKLEQGVADAGDSFTPDITNPQDGDTLVYNAAEQKWVNGAGGGGALRVRVTFETPDAPGVLDKTWQEIWDAVTNGRVVIAEEISEPNPGENVYVRGYMHNISSATNEYFVSFIFDSGTELYFAATSTDEYPVQEVE